MGGGDGRVSGGPLAASRRAAGGGGDRLGAESQRRDASRKPALSGALFGAVGRAGRDRRRIVGAPMGACAGTLRTASARRTGLRDRQSPRLTPVTNAQLVCRLLPEKKKKTTNSPQPKPSNHKTLQQERK